MRHFKIAHGFNAVTYHRAFSGSTVCFRAGLGRASPLSLHFFFALDAQVIGPMVRVPVAYGKAMASNLSVYGIFGLGYGLK